MNHVRRQPRPSVPPVALIALTAAGCVLWAILAIAACYAIIHTPTWLGSVMQ